MMRYSIIFALVLGCVIPVAMWGQATSVDYGELIGQPQGMPLAGAELDEATEALASIMRCPVCQGLSVADSPTTSALAMKQEVHDLLAVGYTEEQVISYFESTYGEFIRLEPRAEGFNLLVWVAPVAALLIGVVLVVGRMRSSRRKSGGRSGLGRQRRSRALSRAGSAGGRLVTDATWLPGLIVLAVGVAAGVFLTLRYARRGRGNEREGEQRLELSDLEHRRDDLYRRLRELGPGQDEERAKLERDAARVLRDLEGLGVQPASVEDAAAQEDRGGGTPVPAAHGRRHAIVGFLFGGAMVALIAVLIFWAGRDAQPRPEQQMAPMNPDEAHELGGLPPEYAAMVQDLEAKIAADPSDLVSRKTLAVLLLDLGQLLPSFQQAEILLEQNPDDIDGLFIHGMVRLRMGQDEIATELFNRVLSQRPDHVRALLGLGAVALRTGDRNKAIEIWQQALDVTGGQDPEIQELISMARAAEAGEPVAPATPPAAPAGPEYRVRVELADAGASGVALFLTLRPAEGAPPAAVKRIMNPQFPLEVVLGMGESMMGQPLPESGVLTARLDSDGSASTRAEGDLEAKMQAAVGESLVLVLGSSP